MKQLKSRKVRALAVVLLAGMIALAAMSPGYVSVSVTGGERDIKVERAGFGPQRVHVETGDTVIESSSGVVP